MSEASGYQEYAWRSDDSFGVGVIYAQLRELLARGRNRTILDLGCGNGSLARRLMNDGFDVWGMDASASGIERANHFHPGRFFQVDLTTRALPRQLQEIGFDTVISTEVIEHLYNPHDLLVVARSALERCERGQLLITAPYHGYLKNLVIALTDKFDHHVDALTTGGHIKFWSRRTLETALRDAGFQVMAFRGCGRVPLLWKSMLIQAEVAPQP